MAPINQKAQLKAIETRYQGFKFRSRLEARWAVFFEKMGLGWKYEIEGYELPGPWYFLPTSEQNKDLRYLPDFFIPAWDCWVEVKAGAATASEMMKCAKLSKEAGKRVLLIIGSPTRTNSLETYQVLSFMPLPKPLGNQVTGELRFAQATDETSRTLLFLENFHCTPGGAIALEPLSTRRLGYLQLGTAATAVCAAMELAQQARFEYGETP